jgi:hypothetical protein
MGGTAASSVIFKDGGASGTTLWKDSMVAQTAAGDKTNKIMFKKPIVFSTDIHATLAGAAAQVEVYYDQLVA